MPTILVVDDELSMREFLSILLEKEGHQVFTAGDPERGLELAHNHELDLVITDIRMGEMSGLDLLKELKESFPDLPVLIITAFASPEDAVVAMKNGAFDYITKPFKVDEINAIINSALESSSQSVVPSQQQSPSHDIIGQSPEMLKIFDLINRIAPTHANVLIYGESGTGKELVAKAIHNNSKAATNEFVPITCNAIPETLFESELLDRKSTRLNSSHTVSSRMPSSA